MTEEEKTILTLEDDDAALVIGSEGIQVVLPEFESGEKVPEYYLYISALAYLTALEGQDFVNEVIDRFTETLSEKGLPEDTEIFREQK